MEELAKVIMNPIRQRIMQHLLIHGKSTTKMIADGLSDVPAPTLYRHIKILSEAAVLLVVEEERVRGAVQKTYALNPEVMKNTDLAGTNILIQNSLNSLGAAFQSYFLKGQGNMEKDMLSFSTSTLLMSDEECKDFFHQIGDVIAKYLSNEPNDDRKARRITLISSPCEEE